MRMSLSATCGAADPTGHTRPGPPGRPLARWSSIVAGTLAALASLSLATIQEPRGTQALFTSQAPMQRNSIVGGDWTPDPPAACGSGYVSVVYGTMADDVLYGGNRKQIIMGLGGNDKIYGGNSGDCLVGGAGDDVLQGGNAKDILLGGPGNDVLQGGNAKDFMNGEDGVDSCDGGNGTDELINCEKAMEPSAGATAPNIAGSLLAPASPSPSYFSDGTTVAPAPPSQGPDPNTDVSTPEAPPEETAPVDDSLLAPASPSPSYFSDGMTVAPAPPSQGPDPNTDVSTPEAPPEETAPVDESGSMGHPTR